MLTTFLLQRKRQLRWVFGALVATVAVCPVRAQSPSDAIWRRQPQNRFQLDRPAVLRQIRQTNTISLPLPDGSLRRFAIRETPLLAPDLQTRYPDIRAYAGTALDNSQDSVRITLTPKGLTALLLSRPGLTVIEPTANGFHQSLPYRALGAGRQRPAAPVQCGVAPRPYRPGLNSLPNDASFDLPASLNQLRTFRLAVTASAEWTAKHGGTQDSATAAIAAIVNTVNAIYERDLSVHFQLSGAVVFTDPSQQPFDDTKSAEAMAPNHQLLVNRIGADKFDIGHLFLVNASSGFGSFESLCNANTKGEGVSPSGSFDDDVKFAVEMVAHEIGHQFNANHTFNTSGSPGCNETQASRESAFEVASGVTIMSYAGICTSNNDPQDLDSTSYGFFHSYTLREMLDAIRKNDGCQLPPSGSATNAVPTLQVLDKATIPARTPFVLTANASDSDAADQPNLTYSWEELDLGAASPPNDDDGSRPLFRNYPPVASPSRYFPSLPYVLANSNNPPAAYMNGDKQLLTGETLPTTSRTMRFRVTVRDNRPADGTVGGTVAFADTLVTVDAGSGPFQITSQNAPETWSAGSTKTITWDVANTGKAPVNCANVDILLSTDGGQTYAIMLASAVPNNGSAQVTLPDGTTADKARVMVKASGGIFFDVNDADLQIQ